MIDFKHQSLLSPLMGVEKARPAFKVGSPLAAGS